MFNKPCIYALFFVLFLTTCKKDETSSGIVLAEFQNGLLPYTSYVGCQDANLASGVSFTNNNLGSCPEGSMGYVNESEGITRYLIQFDISYIPKGVTVKKAFLTLYSSTSSVGNATISCYNKTSFWIAGTNCNVSGGISYTSSNGGGLFDVAPSSNIVLSTGIKNYTFDLSPSVVQNWIYDSTKNYGLLLKSDNETVSSFLWCWFADNSLPNLRPKLSIYYTVE